MLTAAVQDAVGVAEGEPAQGTGQHCSLRVHGLRELRDVGACKDVVGVERQHDDGAVARAQRLQHNRAEGVMQLDRLVDNALGAAMPARDA